MTTARDELTGVAGVVETMLDQALVDTLPANDAPAPWTVTCSALVWNTLGGKAATAALPSGLRDDVSALNVTGGVVRYQDTPVGTYDEVFGAVGFRQGLGIRASVTFMAVDSPASLVGGRTNWAMPKTLAQFGGSIESGSTMTADSAAGTAWHVEAKPRAFGPAIPLISAFTVLQQFPSGEVKASKMNARGRGRAALIDVGVSADTSLPTWLRSGKHLGMLVETMTFTLGEPRAV
ncbi:acetoacetate decarboxylase family protein [Antrihabitans cavernicola]|uniref:Acetoacetate decarboxylase n=1 Tax=Antrihabitans cavernicola TaxID=2495913 RepID=A0A5A7S936_9NOCA|nr:acetoacetate decarboxylase family protein [Spelaeibacter cavernicola]KAA0021662.1 hypothetical protein FOY51_17380 [Spelaeibacter cavernicola]